MKEITKKDLIEDTRHVNYILGNLNMIANTREKEGFDVSEIDEKGIFVTHIQRYLLDYGKMKFGDDFEKECKDWTE